ncbi:MAG TPA: glycosyltransferase family 2 protein [Candidatus Omnitrophota bacterium]|nr:glycosyltransferase family 2 protein [Candidatus Omnitrophota bacterium]
MKVSGFTVARNVIKFDYPAVEAITSILPVCDEFIVNVGDSEDATLDLIRSIGSPKIRIVENAWDPKMRKSGRVLAYQTNLALEECTGDWAFYIQADECVHEKYLPIIRENLERRLNDPEVDGFSFKYVHFYGAYSKVVPPEWDWYKESIRIIRNDRTMISDGDATSFRKLRLYKQRMNSRLNFNREFIRRLDDFFFPRVRNIPSGAEMYHYGWVRPPHIMMQKKIEFESFYSPDNATLDKHPMKDHQFNYGNVAALPDFKGTHPAVMSKRIEAWQKAFRQR